MSPRYLSDTAATTASRPVDFPIDPLENRMRVNVVKSGNLAKKKF
jgi:hypothetical protein